MTTTGGIVDSDVEDNTAAMPNHHRDSSSTNAAAAARLAQQKQRTQALLYLLILCSAGLVAKQSYNSSSFVLKNKSSRYLPESTQGKYEYYQDEAIDPSTLYVPSLDYRIKGISQYSQDHNFEAHIYCTEFAKDLFWEWWQKDETKTDTDDAKTKNLKGTANSDHGNNHDKTAQSTSKRLMIGVYAGYDEYAKLLEQAVWSARVYGQKWGQNVTVVTLQGTSFAPHGCRPTDDSHTTLNKIRLLFHAIDNSDKYDQVLLMDADAFVYNLDVDLTTLLDEKKHLVAAQPLPSSHKRDLWDIHSGVTLWNLNHPYIASVAVDWFERAKKAVVYGTYSNDQEFLQETLAEHLDWQHQNEADHRHDHDDENLDKCIVLNLRRHEFDYENGTFVKQFVKESFRDSGGNGNSTFIEERLQRMQDAAKGVCSKHAQECAAVNVPKYETA